MKNYLISGLISLFTITTAMAQEPATANTVLSSAQLQAAKEHKNVFIIFHASWCGWCHKMDSSMNDPACRQYFENSYVIRHLTVHESKGKKDLENPGALEMLAKYGGEDQGIPFWLILDDKGNLLADSQIRDAGQPLTAKGQNSGCPAKTEEIAYLLKVLKLTSELSDTQASKIETRFMKNAD